MSAYRNFRNVVAERFRDNPGEMKACLQLALEEFAEDGNTETLVKFACLTLAPSSASEHPTPAH